MTYKIFVIIIKLDQDKIYQYVGSYFEFWIQEHGVHPLKNNFSVLHFKTEGIYSTNNYENNLLGGIKYTNPKIQ